MVTRQQWRELLDATAVDLDVAIVDLDGTIHEDADFLPVHLEHLTEEAGAELGAAVTEEVHQILARCHPVPLGALYDADRDEVRPGGLRGDPAAATWDGEPLLDARGWPDDVIYLGDPWQVVRAVATHHRVPRPAQQAAFVRTRQLMNDPATPLPRAGDAAAAAALFAGFGLRVLVSNTSYDLAAPLVVRLGLDEAFDDVRLGANKPEGLAALLSELVSEGGIAPERILCTGDNLRNDIAPARQAGCHTVLVDPWNVAGPEDADLVVGTLAALVAAAH